jgi:hypothetical protein
MLTVSLSVLIARPIPVLSHDNPFVTATSPMTASQLSAVSLSPPHRRPGGQPFDVIRRKLMDLASWLHSKWVAVQTLPMYAHQGVSAG